MEEIILEVDLEEEYQKLQVEESDRADWMPIPTGVPVCPRGLEYLTMIDQLLVHQKVELLEAFLSFETKNKYTIKNSMGQKIYTAKEDTDCCTRNCCGSSRPFDIKIKDNAGMEIIHLSRDLRCSSCCFPCCLQRLEVFAPPGRLIGVVVQEWSICTPQFRIENERVEDLLGDVSIGFYQFGKSFEIILSCLHIRTCCLTMPDNGVNAGPFSKVVKPASTGFKRVFRCLVRGSARGLIQQITVNCSCLLAYDALC
ncbi:Phospholipid scramblase 2 [Araneus ventricosus]|uniref:Phospholipid scramblase n=1 Tax=Araneus ventricosus TaxID=182803 RepID=A0A4Y2SCY4_ARAVE|nr:Phospholipid scramblase 2 [Araneus ventricosus]